MTRSHPVFTVAFLFLLLEASCIGGAPRPSTSPPEVRLYALDCGHFDIKDMGLFADTPEYNGVSGELAVSCFLIRHPQGLLLWDTGLSDSIAESPDGGLDPVGNRARVRTPLRAQLGALGLSPEDVRYVAFSHLHADHAGNANAFTASTWILNRRELDWALQTPTPLGVVPATFSAYRSVKTWLLEGDTDVFGDGSVRILRTPGHTPGHQSLAVQLRHSGTVVLSGDLCHTRENWLRQRVPPFNDSREDTLRSIERIRTWVEDTHGRFVVQHAPEDVSALPRFPAFLE
ncbi:N-acyl homoserine lactonase family protein [Vitiosangium sp. GDMCC 1.1324]|uniref:N-acyl homoserine lactonase family protein n=1 Tax=Vitiosangium sp. (strain GDMCC 1.1324) TaxID=2138576 RepID=UPI000D3D2CEE|nr:N-acyl homoserine lactonase family protein [Vitiosangium sp. GDMCC 1.1324]PTL85067.1 N-acyl homoserine lactonase family protein [Vitiosangium sp. GDMCC 1.1324]